ncbi:MAG: carboxypeptidase-like regulatory domain-containing protein, partial [bacterium]
MSLLKFQMSFEPRLFQRLIIPMLLFSLAFVPVGLAQTTGTISGKIVDARTGDPLPGANVFLRGTTTGAASLADGTYSIENLPPGTYQVVASFIGYHSIQSEVEVVVNEAATADFSMSEDIFRAEEVVVTGIANKRSKSRSEVAVSSIEVSSLTEKQSYTSVDQLVNGKLAGVHVATSSGNVGGGFRFFVRSGGGLNGNEQPVIYIDGVRVDNTQLRPFFTGGQGLGTLSDINPNDIATIEVLKGPAAAASYGTNGSNGVILITTKRGKISPDPRGNLSINYKFTRGTNKKAYDYSSEQFLSANDANNAFVDGDIFQHNLSVSGGNAFIKYYASFEDRSEEGIMLNNSLDRSNLRANIDVFPSDKFNFNVTAGYAATDADVPQNDNNTRGWLGNTLLFARSYRFLDSLSIANLLNKSDNDRFIGSIRANWTPIKNLEATFSVGIDNSDLRWDEFLRSDLPFGGVTSGQRQIWARGNKQLTFDANASYSYNLGRSIQATSTIGAQLFDRERTTAFMQVQNFSSPLITDIGSGADILDKGEEKLNTREAGIFTTHQLSYDDQYFVTLGLRNDFASSIGNTAPDIFYPQASIAVRLDRYDFLPSAFGLFKLRAAYGETGILPDLTDGIPLLWSAESGGFGAGAVLETIGNLEIEPERVKELELGFETEFFRNYALEFTYYQQSSKESIIDFRNAPSTGKIASEVPINIGQVDGWGIESLFQATPIRSRNFQLDLSLVNSFQTNEVKDLGGAQPIFDGFDINVTKEGLRNHEFFREKVIGARFNEDGTYAGPELTEERVPLGNPIPEYTGSASLNLNLFKNLNIYVLA